MNKVQKMISAILAIIIAIPISIVALPVYTCRKLFGKNVNKIQD